MFFLCHLRAWSWMLKRPGIGSRARRSGKPRIMWDGANQLFVTLRPVASPPRHESARKPLKSFACLRMPAFDTKGTAVMQHVFM